MEGWSIGEVCLSTFNQIGLFKISPPVLFVKNTGLSWKHF